MKLFSLLVVAVLTLGLGLTSLDAEAAKRMGGGKSFGKQSSNVTQREATPAPPAAPANSAHTAAPSASKGMPANTAPGAAAPAKKPWGAMLGGLAAGLGLAWLASSLGLGEAFGQFLLMALLALLIMVGVSWVMRRRASAANGGQAQSPFAMTPAAAGAGATPVPMQRHYNPEKVGNDGSARPWEHQAAPFQTQTDGYGGSGSMIGSRLSGGGSNWSVPADFDTAGFLASAKQAFVRLQAAWDKNDTATLGAMMSDEMFSEIRQQLAQRETHIGTAINTTEVAALDAKLLGIEDTGQEWMASVEFSGMIKEDPAQSPGPFREVWNMTKPKDGRSGWVVAGLQALN